MGKDNNVSTGYDKEDDYDPSFGTYVWNSKTGQFFGRTGASWAKLTIFYLIFYAALASFAGLYYHLFSLTLTEEKPKWILGESLIGTNPGMGYRPMPDPDNNADSTLIWYARNKTDDAQFWYQQLEKYMKEVDDQNNEDVDPNCSYNGTKATKTRSCRVKLNTEDLNGCTKNNNFGYKEGDPCILLKLNKIFGWEPSGFGIKDGKYNLELLKKDLTDTEGMPADLKKHILDGVKSYRNYEVEYLSTIWISCGGEGVSDKESIGDVQYYPTRGIPGYYFPYLKQKGYQSPFMFVQLMRPINGMLINVECKAWAKNIFHDRTNRLGSVHFEILID